MLESCAVLIPQQQSSLVLTIQAKGSCTQVFSGSAPKGYHVTSNDSQWSNLSRVIVTSNHWSSAPSPRLRDPWARACCGSQWRPHYQGGSIQQQLQPGLVCLPSLGFSLPNHLSIQGSRPQWNAWQAGSLNGPGWQHTVAASAGTAAAAIAVAPAASSAAVVKGNAVVAGRTAADVVGQQADGRRSTMQAARLCVADRQPSGDVPHTSQLWMLALVVLAWAPGGHCSVGSWCVRIGCNGTRFSAALCNCDSTGCNMCVAQCRTFVVDGCQHIINGIRFCICRVAFI